MFSTDANIVPDTIVKQTHSQESEQEKIKMKEAIYGWYPSVHDIYRPKGRPSSHHLEGLYNFKNYQGQKVSHPPELVVRGVSSRPTTPSCTPQDFKRRSTSVPIPKMHQQSKLDIPTPTQCWSKNRTPPETYCGLVDDLQQSNPPSEVSWPILDDSNQQQHQEYQNLQKHLQHELLRQFIQQQSEKNAEDRNQTEHNGKGLQTPSQDQPLPSSESNLVLAHKALPSRPQSSFPRQSVPCQEKNARKQRPASTPLRSSTQGQRDLMSSLTPRPPSVGSTHTTKWHVRIQSATVQRVKKPPPTRPVTAADIRQTSREELIDYHHSEPERAPTPAPFAVKETACDLQDNATTLPRTPSPEEYSYEKIVEKYGWRAQIPGDPYQLKRPMKRESYTVKCSTQELQPRPPVVHMGTKEPFFYNTIPNKPLSFSVHREWMSEALLVKRLELQKNDGEIKHNYKNFAFVY